MFTMIESWLMSLQATWDTGLMQIMYHSKYRCFVLLVSDELIQPFLVLQNTSEGIEMEPKIKTELLNVEGM